jgi:hypothetical protein
LRLLPVLNGSNVLAPELLVKFLDSLDELRRHIGLCLGEGFGLGCGRHFSIRGAPSSQAALPFWLPAAVALLPQA